MPSILLSALLFVASGGLLTLLVRALDARMNRAIQQHVTAALGPPPPEETFETHVTQALHVVQAMPTQRRGADEMSELTP